VQPNGRPLAVWTNVHDNGWVANAVEMPDGLFAAWAASDATTTSIDYLEDGPENAKRSAEFALKRKSGHTRCSPGCSGWRVHFHETA
jgi:hypothetical protein